MGMQQQQQFGMQQNTGNFGSTPYNQQQPSMMMQPDVPQGGYAAGGYPQQATGQMGAFSQGNSGGMNMSMTQPRPAQMSGASGHAGAMQNIMDALSTPQNSSSSG